MISFSEWLFEKAAFNQGFPITYATAILGGDKAPTIFNKAGYNTKIIRNTTEDYFGLELGYMIVWPKEIDGVKTPYQYVDLSEDQKETVQLVIPVLAASYNGGKRSLLKQVIGSDPTYDKIIELGNEWKYKIVSYNDAKNHSFIKPNFYNIEDALKEVQSNTPAEVELGDKIKELQLNQSDFWNYKIVQVDARTHRADYIKLFPKSYGKSLDKMLAQVKNNPVERLNILSHTYNLMYKDGDWKLYNNVGKYIKDITDYNDLPTE